MSWVTSRDAIAAKIAGSSDVDLPTSVGKYRVLLELGRGGMATVYLAVTKGAAGVSKLVVLKALHNDQESDPDALRMFLDEARLAVQLNHGNLVQTYEIGEQGGRHVIVMEYLEGQSLAHVLRRAEKKGQPLPVALHLRLLIHVLEGLHYVHELRGYDGVALHPVHRDVSPQNVFITYDGRTKVLDFGIAKATSSTTHTSAGLLKGKISYMSPEQMAGQVVDRRADVYAVGCMLWAAATGRKLWKDVSDARVLRDVLDGAIPSPRSENPSCPPELDRIVMKALAKDPEQRYASALELQEDLERLCEALAFQDRPRELARFVSELFADVRDQLRHRIEQELASSQHAAPSFEASALPVLVLPGEAQNVTSQTRAISASTLNAPKQVSAPRHWLWAAALLALGAGATVYGLPSQNRRGPVHAAPPEPAIEKSVPAAEPATVRVVLRSTPPSALLFLDDRALEGNPAQQILTRDDRVHVLRAELAGHRAASAQFTATRDDAVEVTLEKLPLEKLPREQKPGQKGPVALPKVAPRPASRDCDRPFFVDADGIKKIKPNCL